MGYHETETDVFVSRTMANLKFIKSRAKPDGLFEVQQMIMSLLTVVAFPHENYFDYCKLNNIPLNHRFVTDQIRMPSMASSASTDTEHPADLGNLVRLLRNGVSHGNIELLNPKMLHQRRPGAQITRDVGPNDIAGIEIWNCRGNRRTWGTILTVDEIEALLCAMEDLVSRGELRNPDRKPVNGGRPENRQFFSDSSSPN